MVLDLLKLIESAPASFALVPAADWGRVLADLIPAERADSAGVRAGSNALLAALVAQMGARVGVL